MRRRPLIGKCGKIIPSGMSRIACKLLVLVAVLLMPLGMSAPAAAEVHHAASNARGMQHCPEQSPAEKGKLGATECLMACSAALPAFDLHLIASEAQPKMPAQPSAIRTLHGIELEIATPPPRFA